MNMMTTTSLTTSSTLTMSSLEIAKLIRIIRLARDAGYIKIPDGKRVDIMTPQLLQIIFEITQRPGVTVNQLVDATSIVQASVSRNLMALSDWHRSSMPGLGFVETIDDPREYRRKAAFLSKKGQKFVSDVVTISTGKQFAIKTPSARDALIGRYVIT